MHSQSYNFFSDDTLFAHHFKNPPDKARTALLVLQIKFLRDRISDEDSQIYIEGIEIFTDLNHKKTIVRRLDVDSIAGRGKV